MQDQIRRCGECQFFDKLKNLCTFFNIAVTNESLFICKAFRHVKSVQLVDRDKKEIILPKIPESELFVETTSKPKIEIETPSILNKILQPKFVISFFAILLTINFLMPIIYCIGTNHPELFLLGISESVFYYLYLILITIIIKISKYADTELNQLFKEKGNKSKIIMNLFTSKVVYNNFSEQFFKRLYNRKIGFIIILPISITMIYIIGTFRGPGIWIGGIRRPSDPIFDWLASIITTITLNLVYSLIILVIAILINGLREIMQIQNEKEKLSLNTYMDNLKVIMFRKSIQELDKENLSASYYTFQRSNRYIGEFLFKITLYFLILFASISFLSYIIYLFIPPFKDQAIIFSIASVIFSFLSLNIFIIPQIRLHFFLKNTKKETVHILKRKIEELDNYFLLHFQDILLLERINPKWNNVKALKDEVIMLDLYLRRIERLGTWAYNLPDLLKLILGVFGSIIPLILSMWGLQ